MENAAEALKMAGAIMLFVLALSVIIFSFNKVTTATDTIINYKDRETFYIDSSFYYTNGITERTVSLETMIPAIFRAYIENYKIVFEGLQAPIYTLEDVTIKDSSGTIIRTIPSLEKRTLDLETNKDTEYENVVLANDDQKREFLCGILYRDFQISGNQIEFERKFNVKLPSQSLYDQLKNSYNITERLGVYYQNDSPDEPDVNKTEKRVIIYRIN